MNLANTLDCSGLSIAPTVLRIKQALIGLTDADLPLGVSVGSDSDCKRIEASLGNAREDVQLLTEVTSQTDEATPIASNRPTS